MCVCVDGGLQMLQSSPWRLNKLATHRWFEESGALHAFAFGWRCSCTVSCLLLTCKRCCMLLLLGQWLWLRVCRTWLLLDIVSCLPLECMVSAGGWAHNYNLGHLNRCVFMYVCVLMCGL